MKHMYICVCEERGSKFRARFPAEKTFFHAFFSGRRARFQRLTPSIQRLATFYSKFFCVCSFFTPLAKSRILREASPHALAERLRVRPRVREAVPLGVIDELGRHLHAETKVAQPSA